ncbi:MAG: DegT/DnrJ/EryC1/StrS family aminotransferase, partial [Burkholderiales bacterium]
PNLKPAQSQHRERNAHHLYVVRIDYQALGKSRNAFMRALRERSILCQVHYIPAHMQPYYKTLGFEDKVFPVAERYYESVISLPLFPALAVAQQDTVVDELRKALA